MRGKGGEREERRGREGQGRGAGGEREGRGAVN